MLLQGPLPQGRPASAARQLAPAMQQQAGSSSGARGSPAPAREQRTSDSKLASAKHLRRWAMLLQRRLRVLLLLATGLLAGAATLWLLVTRSHASSASAGAAAAAAAQARARAALSQSLPASATPLLSTGRDHLCLYVFSHTDPEYLHNLEYFVAHAVAGDTLADTVIIVQQGPGLKKAALPELPAHAAYVEHANECYDWGTYGWLLRSGLVNAAQYRFFVFVNSSVRGPFLPAYARGELHWMSAFTSRLSADVKLVGSTISCEGSPLHGKRSGEWRTNPHVQSYAVATDADGLRLLLADEHVFGCHSDRWDAIFFAEMGSSKAILDAGFNLDCLLLRYQGLDWRDRANWGCNARVTPAAEFSLDGQTLDPLEVLFVKVKSYMISSETSFTKKALKYQTWQAATWPGGDFGATAANEWAEQAAKFRTPGIMLARARGANCFDFEAYAKANPDLAGIKANLTSLWRHFVYTGQFQGRPHRWSCEVEYANLTRWHPK